MPRPAAAPPPPPRPMLLLLLLLAVLAVSAAAAGGIESQYPASQLCHPMSVDIQQPDPPSPSPLTPFEKTTVQVNSLLPLAKDTACIGLFLVGLGTSGNTLPSNGVFAADKPFYVEKYDGALFGGKQTLKKSIYQITTDEVTGTFRVQIRLITAASTKVDTTKCTMTLRTTEEKPPIYTGPSWGALSEASAVSPRAYLYNGINSLSATLPKDLEPGAAMLTRTTMKSISVTGLLEPAGADGWIGVFASTQSNFQDPNAALSRVQLSLVGSASTSVMIKPPVELDASKVLETMKANAGKPLYFEVRAYSKDDRLLAKLTLGNVADAVAAVQNIQPVSANQPLTVSVSVNDAVLRPQLLSSAAKHVLRVQLVRGGACVAGNLDSVDMDYPPFDHTPVALTAPGSESCTYNVEMLVLDFNNAGADPSRNVPDRSTAVLKQSVKVIGEPVSMAMLTNNGKIARGRQFGLRVALGGGNGPLSSDRIAIYDATTPASNELLGSYFPAQMGIVAGSSTMVQLRPTFPPDVTKANIKYLSGGEFTSAACDVTVDVVEGGLCDASCGTKSGAECIEASDCGSCSATSGVCVPRNGRCSTFCSKANIPCLPSAQSSPSECGTCKTTANSLRPGDACVDPNKPGRCSVKCANAGLSCLPSSTVAPQECGSCVAGMTPGDICVDPSKQGRCDASCAKPNAACSPSATRAPYECGGCPGVSPALACVDKRKPQGRCSARCENPGIPCAPDANVGPIECGVCNVKAVDSCVVPSSKPGRCAQKCQYPGEPCAPSGTTGPTECGACALAPADSCVVVPKNGRCSQKCEHPGIPCAPDANVGPTECGTCAVSTAESCEVEKPGRCSPNCKNPGVPCAPSAVSVPLECGNCGVIPAESCVVPVPGPGATEVPSPPPCIELRDRQNKPFVPGSMTPIVMYELESNKDEYNEIRAYLHNDKCGQMMAAAVDKGSMVARLQVYQDNPAEKMFRITFSPTEDNAVSEMLMNACGCQTLLRLRVRGPACVAYGDPHITSFDGKGTMFQGVGDFSAIRSADKTANGLEVQLRLGASAQLAVKDGKAVEIPENTGDKVISTPKGVAIREGGVQVGVYVYNYVIQDAAKASLFVVATDGTRTNRIDVRKLIVPKMPLLGTNNDLGYVQLHDGTHLQYDQIHFFTAGGTQITFANYMNGGTAASVSVRSPQGASKPSGICGDQNGDPNNDVLMANGSRLAMQWPNTKDIYEAFSTWRVANLGKSLFVYDHMDMQSADGTDPLADVHPLTRAQYAAMLGHKGKGPTLFADGKTKVYGDELPEDSNMLPSFSQVNRDTNPLLTPEEFDSEDEKQAAHEACLILKTAAKDEAQTFYDSCMFDVKATKSVAYAQASISAQAQRCMAINGKDHEDCKVATCNANSCQNGGVCALSEDLDGSVSYRCSCPEGFLGDVCGVSINDDSSTTSLSVIVIATAIVVGLALIVALVVFTRRQVRKRQTMSGKLRGVELHSPSPRGSSSRQRMSSTPRDHAARPSSTSA